MSSEMRKELEQLADECEGLEGLGSAVIGERIRAILARTEAGAVAQCDRPGCCCPTLLRNECAKRWTREELKSPQGLDDDCLDDRAWAKAIEDALGLACGLAVIEGDAYDWIMAKANELCPHAAPVADGLYAWVRESPRHWERVTESDLSQPADPQKMRAGGWFPVYTHPPQDASGDAEDAARWRHVRKDGLIWRVNMLALAKDDIDILFGAKADAAVDAAMQAKEAK